MQSWSVSKKRFTSTLLQRSTQSSLCCSHNNSVSRSLYLPNAYIISPNPCMKSQHYILQPMNTSASKNLCLQHRASCGVVPRYRFHSHNEEESHNDEVYSLTINFSHKTRAKLGFMRSSFHKSLQVFTTQSHQAHQCSLHNAAGTCSVFTQFDNVNLQLCHSSSKYTAFTGLHAS